MTTKLKSLDTNSPAPGHRRIWSLAGPIILSNVSVPLVGIVDTAVIGQLDEPAFIGAIALGALIFSFLYWGFGFLRMGTTGIVAQAFGEGDNDEIRATVVRSSLLALAIGVAILLLQQPVLQLSMAILDASAQVEQLTATYFEIRVITAPAVMLHYVALGALVGLQNTRAALWIQLTLNLTNVVLDIVFVYWLGMDVAGVATATVISEYLALAVGAILIYRALRKLPGRLEVARLVDREKIARLFEVGGNLFVRSLCVIIGHSWFTATGASFGDIVLAANAVLMLLVSLLAYALDGFAHAAEALVGEAWGRRSLRDYQAAVRVSTLWACLTAALFSAVYLAAGMLLVELITATPAVREAARTYIGWVIVAPLIVVWAYQFDGIFVGTTHTREMRNSMIASLGLFALCNLTLVPRFGNHGLWFSLVVFMAARSVTMYWFSRTIPERLAKREQQVDDRWPG